MSIIKNKICLVGFMGVGKSTFGKKIAKDFNIKFVDTDRLISERENLSINEIFKQKGENYFRTKEEEVLKEILAFDEELIIATGGGIGANDSLMHLMKEQSIVVFLFLPIEAIYKRLQGKSSHRPLVNEFEENKLKIGLGELYNNRLPIYSKADIIIDAHYLKKLSKEDLLQLLDDNSSLLLTKQHK